MSELRNRVETDKNKEQEFLQLRKVMEAVEAYNTEHSTAAELALFMFGRRDAKEVQRYAADLEERRRQTLVDAIKMREAGLGMGLEIDFGSEEAVALFTPGQEGVPEVVSPAKIGLNLVNAEAFAGFLHKVESADFERTPKLKDDVASVIWSFSQQIWSQKFTNEQMMPLVEGARKIVDEFKRLGLEEKTKFLDESLMNAQRSTLDEFLLFTQAQCFEAPDGNRFGPNQWHIDMNPNEYRNRWEATMAAVLKGLKNNNARAMTHDVIKNLIACANNATENMDSTSVEKEREFGVKDRYEDFRKICEEYKQGFMALLSQIKEPEVN